VNRAGTVNRYDADSGRVARPPFPPAIPYRRRLLETAWINFCAREDYKLHVAYEQFCNAHRHWLKDYALFRALKARYNDACYLESPVICDAGADRARVVLASHVRNRAAAGYPEPGRGVLRKAWAPSHVKRADHCTRPRRACCVPQKRAQQTVQMREYPITFARRPASPPIDFTRTAPPPMRRRSKRRSSPPRGGRWL
jgi:4-alpha-glucanotransferase